MNKLSPLTQSFISHLEIGQKLYYFPTEAKASNETDYILFTIIDVKGDEVVLQGAFDQKERKKVISRSDFMDDKHWRYNPSFK